MLLSYVLTNAVPNTGNKIGIFIKNRFAYINVIPMFMIQGFVNPVANIEIELYCESVNPLSC